MKKVIVIILVLLISSLFYSCKSRKVISEITKTDTIYKSEIIKITPAQLNTIKIESVCDSLGRLKSFNYTFTNGSVKTVLKTIKDTLYLESNVDSIVNSKVNEYKSSITKDKQVIIKEVKRPLNWYLLIYSLIASIWIFRKPLIRLIKPF